MNELRFETGLVSYSINDKAEVSFNPTDMSFISLRKASRIRAAVRGIEMSDQHIQIAQRLGVLLDDGQLIYL